MSRIAPILALVLAALLLGAAWSAEGFPQAYLAAVAAWASVSLGALTLVAANALLGGEWGPLVARSLIPAMRAIPLAGLLFLPLLLAPEAVWPWARAGWEPDGPGKALWFDPAMFAIRTLGYFTAWTLLAWWLPEPGTLPRALPRAVTALAAQFLFGSLAAVDWLLSLDPAFNSSIFGLLVLAHQTAGAMAFAVLTRDTRPVGKLGAILLATVIAWGYFAAMQFLVVWTGNLPHEARWYLERLAGGWRSVAWAVIVLHVVLPALGLMWRAIRLVRRRLWAMAAVVFAGFLLDAAWLAHPAAAPATVLMAFAGVGLVWLAGFGVFRARMPPPPPP